jgi:hypothetical protein
MNTGARDARLVAEYKQLAAEKRAKRRVQMPPVNNVEKWRVSDLR